jgi:hypothetical protein
MKNVELLVGIALGAGLMYVLDPDSGRRRRALVRDQIAHGRHELEELEVAARARSRDLRNRARGAAAETRARVREDHPDDEVLEARVRSEIGRTVSNPRAIEVAASDGHVMLSGPVLDREREELLSRARSVRGVSEIEDRLEPHDSPADVPGLQGTEA